MPATATRPATARQLSFLNTLCGERTLPLALSQEVAAVVEGGPIARDLIDRVMAVTPTRGTRRQADGTAVAAPNNAIRAGRMLQAGGIEATVTLPSGEHVTLKVRTRRPEGRGWTNAAPGENGARTNIHAGGSKIGWVNVDAAGTWTVTLRTRREDVANAVFALFAFAATGHADLRVQAADRCGRCMRTLTDPVSIDRGIGPECFGADTGSRHVRVDAPAAVEAPAQPRLTGDEITPAAVEARMDAAFAERERQQERAAFASDPDYRAHQAAAAAPAASLTDLAATADKNRARALIAEALDAYCTDADRDFAMRMFDQLAAR